MKSIRFWMTIGTAAFLLVVAFMSSACSTQQPTPNYPTKPIDLITPWGVGGGADLSTRLMAKDLSAKWAQPINVINLPGAAAVTGTKRVLDASPDGYTMLQDGHGGTSLQSLTVDDVPYKMLDRTFIAHVLIDPVYFVVGGDSPWKSLKEAMDYAKANPGKFRWSAAGMSSIGVFAMAHLFDESGVDFGQTNLAQFDSAATAMNAVAGGQADMSANVLGTAAGLVDAGKLKLLAVAVPQRVKKYADVPTVKESGYNFKVNSWQGISGPMKMPDYVVNKWVGGLQEICKDPKFIDEAENQLAKTILLLGPEETKKLVEDDYAANLPIAKKVGLKK